MFRVNDNDELAASGSLDGFMHAQSGQKLIVIVNKHDYGIHNVS